MQVIAEMVGTFIMMYCIYGIVAITELRKGQVGLLEYASTAGFAIIVVIFTVGPISGAHVNPSITIAFAASGQFPWSMVSNPISLFLPSLYSKSLLKLLDLSSSIKYDHDYLVFIFLSCGAHNTKNCVIKHEFMTIEKFMGSLIDPKRQM